MSEDRETNENEDLLDADVGAAISEIIENGDLSRLSTEERVRYVAKVCKDLKISPMTMPLQFLRLQGKLVLYVTRAATDQLAANARLTREIVDGPRVMDFAGTKMLYAVCRVTHPNGRAETATATVPLNDPLNGIMKVECVPLNSEILTRRGFKMYSELTIGEEVLAYNKHSDLCEWVPLENVSVYRSAPVYLLHTEGGRFSFRCTHDHSWAAKRAAYKQRGKDPTGPRSDRLVGAELVQASKIATSSKIVVAAKCLEGSHPLSPAKAAVLGWVMTDGVIKRQRSHLRLSICQSKEKNFDSIRSALADAGISYHETVGRPTVRTFPSGKTYKCLPQHWFIIKADDSRRLFVEAGISGPVDMPSLVTALSPSARASMLEAMMAADATKEGIFGKKRKPGVMESWQILCALEGIALGRIGKSSAGDIPIQRARLRRHVAGSNLTLSHEGEAPVWCPTTKHGTWVMRQDGNVTITGNTKAKRRATLAILGLAMLDPEENQLAEEGRELSYASPELTEKRDGSKGPLLSFIESLSQVSAPIEAVGHWLLWRDRLSVLVEADRKRAWLEICKRVTSVGGVSDASTWLMKAVNEENARRAAAAAGPPSSPVTSSAKASSLSSSDQERLDEMSVRLAGMRTSQADAETCARELCRMASESRLSEQAMDVVSVIAKNYLCLREYQRLVSQASLTDGPPSGGSTSSNEDSGVVGLRDLVESMSRGGQGDVIDGLKFPSAAHGNNDDPLSAESSAAPVAPSVEAPIAADKKALPEDPRLQNLRKMLNACVSIKSLTGMIAVWRSCAKGLPSNLRGAGFVTLKKAMGLFDPSIDESKIAVFVKNDENDPVELAKERDFCSPVDLPLWQAYLLKAERDGAVSGSYAKRHEKLRAAHGNGEMFESFRSAAIARIVELRTCSELEASTLLSDVVRRAEKQRAGA